MDTSGVPSDSLHPMWRRLVARARLKLLKVLKKLLDLPPVIHGRARPQQLVEGYLMFWIARMRHRQTTKTSSWCYIGEGVSVWASSPRSGGTSRRRSIPQGPRGKGGTVRSWTMARTEAATPRSPTMNTSNSWMATFRVTACRR